MTLSMLECFIATMKTLNFTSAAQDLHISQPALSRNIAAIENELGFPLFIRSKQLGLTATPAGEEYYRGLMNIWQDYQKLLRDVTLISRGEQGKLDIGILSGVCVDSLTKEAIRQFHDRYPNVQLQAICYHHKQMIDSVAEGKIDTCIMLSKAVKDRDDLHYEEIMQVDNYLAIPSRLKCDTTVIHSLKEFENLHFILSEDSPAFNRLLVSACRSAGFEPKTLIAPDFETKMLWSEFGLGVSVNSNEHYIKNSPEVDFVRIKEIGSDNLAIIWKKGNNNPSVQLFAAVLHELISKEL